MKTLSNLIAKTKDKVRRGAKIGAYVGLSALASGGCTVVPPTPEVIVCSYDEDSDNDGLEYPKDYKKIGNDFNRNERITINYTKPKPGDKITFRIYDENKKEIMKSRSVIMGGEENLARCFLKENSLEQGLYEVRIFIDDRQVQTAYFSVQ